jgi:5-methyltetrahydropteroyltriglutamate--homocysteine methyltransferase
MALNPCNPPFRADQVGSLMRPPVLIEARNERQAGELSAEALRAIEDHAIRDVVKMQESVGLRSISDGEYRRRSYIIDFFQKAAGPDGVSLEQGTFFHKNAKGDRVHLENLIVHKPMRWSGPIFANHYAFLRSITAHTPKITLPSPAIIHFLGGEEAITRHVYASLDQFWADLIEVYRSELAALAEAGCTYVQFDETSVVKVGDPEIRRLLEGRGENCERLIAMYVEVLNAAFAAVPPSITAGVHICRGNRRGYWQAEAGYEFTAGQLFRKLNASFYFLEFDSPRAGPLDVLRMMPDGKTVILGLITNKSPQLEAPDEVRARIREAARYMPMDRLGLSCQCGFSGNIGNTTLTMAEQTAKLKLVVDVARTTWPDA